MVADTVETNPACIEMWRGHRCPVTLSGEDRTSRLVHQECADANAAILCRQDGDHTFPCPLQNEKPASFQVRLAFNSCR